MRALAAAAAVALVLAACDRGGDDGEVSGRGLRGSGSAAGADPSPPTETSRAVPSPAAPSATARPGSEPRPGDPVWTPTPYDNQIPLEIRVEPGCGMRGEAMTLHGQTHPDVFVGIAIEYAQRGYRPDAPTAPVYSDPQGRFTWGWVLRPDAPIGQAIARVAAGRAKVGGAAADTRFFVRERC